MVETESVAMPLPFFVVLLIAIRPVRGLCGTLSHAAELNLVARSMSSQGSSGESGGDLADSGESGGESMFAGVVEMVGT